MTFVAGAIFLGIVGIAAILAIAVILRDFWWPSAKAKEHHELLRQIIEQQHALNKLVSELSGCLVSLRRQP